MKLLKKEQCYIYIYIYIYNSDDVKKADDTTCK